MLFDTTMFDTADLRPVLITGPARTARARELIDAIVAASSATVSVARRLDTITAAVVRPSSGTFVGILDTGEDLRGLIAVAPAAGVRLIVLSRTSDAVNADLRGYMREVVAA